MEIQISALWNNLNNWKFVFALPTVILMFTQRHTTQFSFSRPDKKLDNRLRRPIDRYFSSSRLQYFYAFAICLIYCVYTVQCSLYYRHLIQIKCLKALNGAKACKKSHGLISEMNHLFVVATQTGTTMKFAWVERERARQ